MFTLVTSEDVVAEATSKLRDVFPELRGTTTGGLRRKVAAVFDEVVEDFGGKLPFPGSDVGDQHVHAAAVITGASTLLTSDKGFLDMSEGIADLLPYESYSPDDFFTLLDDSQPKHVREMTQRQINHWVSRGEDPRLTHHLEQAECPQFADRVSRHVADLGGRSARRKFDAMSTSAGSA